MNGTKLCSATLNLRIDLFTSKASLKFTEKKNSYSVKKLCVSSVNKTFIFPHHSVSDVTVVSTERVWPE